MKHGGFWCKDEAAFLRLKALMEDGDSWPVTYAEWLKLANDKLKQARNAGIIITKIYVDPDEFAAWCEIHSRKANGAARKDYAAIKAGEQSDVNN